MSITATTLREGLVLRRPDGQYVLLECRLDDGIWGCDLLEDADGHPDPKGYPACHGLRLPAADLLTYDRV